MPTPVNESHTAYLYTVLERNREAIDRLLKSRSVIEAAIARTNPQSPWIDTEDWDAIHSAVINEIERTQIDVRAAVDAIPVDVAQDDVVPSDDDSETGELIP